MPYNKIYLNIKIQIMLFSNRENIRNFAMLLLLKIFNYEKSYYKKFISSVTIWNAN